MGVLPNFLRRSEVMSTSIGVATVGFNRVFRPESRTNLFATADGLSLNAVDQSKCR